MKRSLCFALLGVVAGPLGLAAQRLTWPERVGDSTAAAPLLQLSRTVFEHKRRTVSFESPDNLIGIARGGATRIIEADAPDADTTARDVVTRVVAETTTPDGRYGVEYYFRRDSAFFMFDYLVFASDQRHRASWRNFRDEPAWERRVYWRGDSVVFIETSGRPARLTPTEAIELLLRGERLRSLLARRAP